MKCRKVRRVLIAYLDNELGKEDRFLIEEHLERCKVCQQELSALELTRSQVTETLRTMALETSPSTGAWARLATGLRELGAAEGSSHGRSRGGRRSLAGKRRWAMVAAAVVVVAACVVGAVPPIRSATADFFFGSLKWYRAEPLQVGYLPSGFDPTPVYQVASTGVPGEGKAGKGGEQERQGILAETVLYRSGAFFVFIRTEPDTGLPLPEGQAVEINGHDAVWVCGLSGVVLPPHEILAEPDSPAATDPRCVLAYENASALVWIVDGVRVEVLSNVPAEEIQKVAQGIRLGRLERTTWSP